MSTSPSPSVSPTSKVCTSYVVGVFELEFPAWSVARTKKSTVELPSCPGIVDVHKDVVVLKVIEVFHQGEPSTLYARA